MRDSATATRNTPLAPSTEKAYHQKCLELKRRLREIEDANDATRQRKRRVDRAILKMRLERAFLLERLAKNQVQLPDGAGAVSDKSTSPPQTPQERAPRVRRQHQKSPQTDRAVQPGPTSPPPPTNDTLGASSAYPPQPAPLASAYPPHPPPTHAATSNHSAGESRGHVPYKGPPIDRRAPSEVPSHEQLPLINSLPNGTNVVIIDGQPKQPPWTIRDVEPRHHLRAGFEKMDPEQQYEHVQIHGYTPYDNLGNPVILHQYDNGAGIRHVFRDDPEWEDPVVNNVRMDDPFRKRAARKGSPEPGLARSR